MIILGGPPGTGKTTAACGIIRDLRCGHYTKAVSYAGIAQNEEHRRKLYQQTKVLVLDDLGMDPDFSRWRMNELLAHRYDGPAGWFTLITTNLSKPELEAKYDKTTVDRIAEKGGYMICDETMRRPAKDR
jgi:DNA replication protein DnaC